MWGALRGTLLPEGWVADNVRQVTLTIIISLRTITACCRVICQTTIQRSFQVP